MASVPPTVAYLSIDAPGDIKYGSSGKPCRATECASSTKPARRADGEVGELLVDRRPREGYLKSAQQEPPDL